MRIGTAAFATGLLLMSAVAAAADQPPLYKELGDWSGRCMSTGLCVVASGPFEIVRGWAWDAKPLVCYYGPDGAASAFTISIGGQDFAVAPDPSPVGARQIAAGHHAFEAYVRQQQRNGRAACKPAEADPKLLEAMAKGEQATVSQAGKTEPLPLAGFTALAEWIDARQQRTETSGALLKPGAVNPPDAPHAAPLLQVDPLPHAVQALYDEPKAACTSIRPDNFDGGGAARIALGGGTELFLLPCGEPGSNQPVLAVTLLPDGRAVNLKLEFISDGKRLSDVGGMNLVWDGRDHRLVGRQSMGYACTVETQWRRAGYRFELDSQAQTIGCTKPDAPDARAWTSVWRAAATEGGAPAAAPSQHALLLTDQGLGPFEAGGRYDTADVAKLGGAFKISRAPKVAGEAGYSSTYELTPTGAGATGKIDVSYAFHGPLVAIEVTDPAVKVAAGHGAGSLFPVIVPEAEIAQRCGAGLETLSGLTVCTFPGTAHLAAAFSQSGYSGPDGQLPPASVLAQAHVVKLLWLDSPKDALNRGN